MVRGIRRLSLSPRRRARRAALVRALILAYLLSFAVAVRGHVTGQATEFARQRAQLLGQLETAGGRHLVVVRYGRDHNIHEEWVQNEAQIDAAPVIWGRSMGAEADRTLCAYFADRRCWLLRADAAPLRLIPYAPAHNPGPVKEPVEEAGQIRKPAPRS